MQTSSFWLISVGHACALLTVSAVLVHLVPQLTGELSLSLTTAGLIVEFLTGFQLAGQIIGGFLGDQFNKNVICMLGMFGHAMGLLLLAYAFGIWMILASMVLHRLS